MPSRRRRAFIAVVTLLAASGVVAPVALTTSASAAPTGVVHRVPGQHRRHVEHLRQPRTVVPRAHTRPVLRARPTPRPSVTPTPSATTSPSATPTSSPTPTPSPGPTGLTLRSDWARAVLDQLNAERARHGLPALASSSALTGSAHRHNAAMAGTNTLSHQLPGEAGLGDRVSAAGYRWSACGENIAWNSDRSQAGVLALETAMYSEVPPNDGHRRNILSTTFTEVGIDVVVDDVHRKVWLTTDFGRPR